MKNIIVIMVCMIFINAANSQSIASDGDFDLNITGWHCGSVNPTWISDDGSGLSGNGSLQISRENFFSTGGQLAGGHCNWITVQPENDYQFDGFYKLPSNSEFENIMIDFYWYTEDESFISVDSNALPTNTIIRDTWISFDYLSSAPVNATKLSISLAFQFYPNGQNEVSAFLRWDDLYLINYIDDIFSDDFE